MKSNLAQLPQQVVSLWNRLAVRQRVGLAAAVTIIGVGLAAAAVWSGHTDYALLYGRLDDTEAAHVLAALDDAKIPYRIGRSGNSIYVAADKVHQVRMQLAGKGIPKSDGVGFEIFDKSNFGISDFVQRANYIRALQGELARTISQLDEVDAARVMIVLPENRLLLSNNRETTASVFVRVKGNASLATESVHSIRFLVANAVEGLQPNRVTVVDNHGTVLAENDSEDSLAGLTSNHLAARQKLELYLGQKAQSMLEKVLGPGQAVVRVAVELNQDTVNRTEERFDPKGQVLRTSTLADDSSDSTSANNNNPAPGMATNASVDTNATASASTSTASHTRRKTENAQYEITKTTSSTVQAPGAITRVSAAVFVAAAPSGPDHKPVVRPPEEIEKLRRIVQSALGLQLGEDANRRDEITLEEMSFNDWTTATTPEPGPVPPVRPPAWWGIAAVAGGAVVVVLLLLVVLGRRREPVVAGTRAPAPVAGPVAAIASGNGHGEEEVTVESLNRLLRENPGPMTHAVRGWLGQTEETGN